MVAGKANLAEAGGFQADALLSLLDAVPHATVLPAFRRGNVVGALQLGMVPGPGGNFTAEILRDVVAGTVTCLVLVGVDPVADFPDSALAVTALASARSVVAVDTFLTASAQHADVVLAAAAAGEKAGTVTNLEGRVQSVARKVNAAGTSRPDWMIAADLASRLGGDLGFSSVDDVTEAIAAGVPAYAGITPAALNAARDGLLAVRAPTRALQRAGLEPPAASGYDYRLVVSRELYDLGVLAQMSPSLAPLGRGLRVHVHPLDLERLGLTSGGEVKVSNLRATKVLRVVGDEGVTRGCAWMPFNQRGGSAGDFIDAMTPVTDVRIETL